jgi:hypothetical protein
MTGGQGQAYRSGHIVLKPAKDDEETNWIAEFYLTVDCDGFQLPTPIRSGSEGFVCDGWQAWEYIKGEHRKRRWVETIEVCIRFHQAIAGFPQPAYFDRRERTPWVVADKVAWGEMEIEHHPRIEPAVEQLRKCLDEVNGRSQLIHGDFGVGREAQVGGSNWHSFARPPNPAGGATTFRRSLCCGFFAFVRSACPIRSAGSVGAGR